jgi:endonuclease/exonuclease/phosphatase family metal-dependent hydrolase
VHIDQDLKEGSYSIARKLRNAFRQRSAHVLHLKEQLAASPYPVVVCGDFNDTPTSFAYRQIKSNLKDTFLESGNGYAYTFKGNFPVPLRIDYILVSESIRSSSYYTRKIALSDHLPVAAILNLTD